MMLLGWLSLLGIVGVSYAVWHLDRAWQAWRRNSSRSTEPLTRWVATGDLLMWVTVVVLATLFFLVDMAPLLDPRIAAFAQQAVYITLHSVFVIGMALSRLHALQQPLVQQDRRAGTEPEGEAGDGR